MLSGLYIKNIAVIEKADIEFSSGFNVLTGETGAGKSIIIDAINAVLGERTSKEIVRNGAVSARVCAVFSGISLFTVKRLAALGFEPDEEQSIMIQRDIHLEGKNICRVNGSPVTVSVLRQIGNLLINIHGQHDSQSLLIPDRHTDYLDALGDYADLQDQYLVEYKQLRDTLRDLNALNMDEGEKARRIDLLQYQINELSEADLTAGERADLIERQSMILNSEKISGALSLARECLAGSDQSEGAVSLMSATASALTGIANVYPEIESIASRLQEISYELDDASSEISDMSSRLDFDNRELDDIGLRLDTLYRLSRKYGETEEQMLAFLQNATEQLENIELADERILKLTKQAAQCKQSAMALAAKITVKRQQAAKLFTQKVAEELKFLDMSGVCFEVVFHPCPMSSKGLETAEFLISVNPGELPRPIAKIASGGELSRIMLAIKNVFADKDEIDTLIFDEIDTGISGRAAQKVGIKLRQAAASRQIICVTHSAQIASHAHEQLLIQKHVKNDRTFTDVIPLDLEGRKQEIARIMGGELITELTLQNAEEMLKVGNKA